MLSRPDAVPGRRLPLPSGQSLHPAATSHRGATLHEASTEVHPIHPSGLPLACSPRDGAGTLRRSPVLRTPPSPAAHDRTGPGVSTRPELRDRHNRPSNPRVHCKVRPRVATARECVPVGARSAGVMNQASAIAVRNWLPESASWRLIVTSPRRRVRDLRLRCQAQAQSHLPCVALACEPLPASTQQRGRRPARQTPRSLRPRSCLA